MSRTKRNVCIAVDSREQLPYMFDAYEVDTRSMTLQHGDYAVVYPDIVRSICIERKTIDDFARSAGTDRKRFTKELNAMRGYKYSVVVIEAHYTDILQGKYRSMVTPESLAGTIARWNSQGIQFQFAGTRTHAEQFVYNYCMQVAKDVLRYATNATQMSIAVAQAAGEDVESAL